MLDLLRSLEWANVGPCCPSCERVKMDGHAPDCRLDRAIRDLASSAIEEVPEPSPLVVGDRVVALTPHGWADATILRIEASGPVLIRTESGVTWLVERERIRRQDQTLGPTVDEMAREMGLTWSESAGAWAQRTGGYPTFPDVRTLYREHKARQADPPAATVDDFGGVHCPACHCVFGEVRIRNGKQAICPNCGRRVRMKEEPPTDPAALAAWLYARVMPGRTVVEWEAPSVDRVRRCKSLVVNVEIDGDHIVVWPNDSALYIPPPSKHVTRATRLLNPDGTVLWEAK